MTGQQTPRHPVTGRYLAFNCETDCQEHCAGLCGESNTEPLNPNQHKENQCPYR